MNERQLMDLKEQINQAKITLAKIKGKKEYILKELKQLGCENIDIAKEKVKEIEESILKKDTQLNKLIEEIENMIQEEK